MAEIYFTGLVPGQPDLLNSVLVPTKLDERRNFVKTAGLSGSDPFGAFIDSDGRLLVCGRFGGFSEFGVSTNFYTSPFVLDNGPWLSVCAGYDRLLAIRLDGTLWGMGTGTNGQLGTGVDFVTLPTLTRVGSDSDWAYLAWGVGTAYGIKTNGTLWSWGEGTVGQLGNGSTTSTNYPTQAGTASDWVSVTACGNRATAQAIKADGSLWSWGQRSSGTLGLGSGSGNVLSPVNIPGLWKSVHGSANHVYGIKSDDTLWGWGRNDSGQMLYPSSTILSPVEIAPGTQWKTVARIGGNYSMGIRLDGSLWSWGRSSRNSVLGQGETLNSYYPPARIGALTGWLAVEGGIDSAFALLDASTPLFWAANVAATETTL